MRYKTPVDGRLSDLEEVSQKLWLGFFVENLKFKNSNFVAPGRYFKGTGAEFDQAHHSQEALVKRDDKQYDLVLTDLQKPMKDGYEALAEKRRRGFKIPVAELTAHTMREERLRCLNAGSKAHFGKPIES